MIADRCKDITSFIVMDVLEKAKEMEANGINVIHLEVGEPDFDAPCCIRDAVVKALDEGHTHYTHSLGMLELREAIAKYYKRRYNVSFDPDQVAVSSGTSPVMFVLFSAILDEGDEVIISDPHYACYPNFIKFAGGIPVCVNVNEDDGFQLRVEEIQKKLTAKTKAVFINSPSNPTGNLLSVEAMEALGAFSKETGIAIVSDEIYHGLVYEGKEHSILEYTDNAFVLNGFSKQFAMTGLRLGYLVSPKEYMRTIQKLQQNFFISATAMVQIAGIAALEKADEDVKRMRETYNERRKFIIKRLREIGFGITVEPTGAFYVLANAKKYTGDSYKFAFDILEKAHIGVTPGIDFGKNAEGYLRFSYANSVENIAEGMNRLEKYIQENYPNS